MGVTIKWYLKVFLVLMLTKSEVNTALLDGLGAYERPCIGNDDIKTDFSALFASVIGSFYININKEMEAGTEIEIKLTEDAIMTLSRPEGNITRLPDNVYKIVLFENTTDLRAHVTGERGKGIIVVQLLSVKINGEEQCTNPFAKPRFAEKAPEPKVSDPTCGRRKVNHNQLIVYGATSKPGDWPWHVALNRIYQSTFRYICGGTLISDVFVLTAGHCVTKNGVVILTESLGVSLGKHNLIGGDKEPQEREVYKIIVHEEFDHRKLDNDIALLKLSTAAIYNDYIQPACLWYDLDDGRKPTNTIIGAVAGWGFDQSKSLSSVLHHTKMPLVQDVVCIRRKPIFYGPFMNGKRFCAGSLNGSSACNGDSGGGFVVFVPDNPESNTDSDPPGVWYLRGIVSLAYSRQDDVSTCDPNEYVLFTDVEQYKDWINDHISNK